MSNRSILEVVTGGFLETQEDWMSASQVRAFIFEDLILVWLDRHGQANGFEKDASPHKLTDFIFEKGDQFEAKWVAETASEEVRVRKYPWDVKRAQKVRGAWELMQACFQRTLSIIDFEGV